VTGKKEREYTIMKADVNVKAHDEEEAQYHIGQLKRYGYKRISNCYWYERWEKDNWVVEIERDF
jgi:hypothetical protein